MAHAARDFLNENIPGDASDWSVSFADAYSTEAGQFLIADSPMFAAFWSPALGSGSHNDEGAREWDAAMADYNDLVSSTCGADAPATAVSMAQGPTYAEARLRSDTGDVTIQEFTAANPEATVAAWARAAQSCWWPQLATYSDRSGGDVTAVEGVVATPDVGGNLALVTGARGREGSSPFSGLVTYSGSTVLVIARADVDGGASAEQLAGLAAAILAP